MSERGAPQRCTNSNPPGPQGRRHLLPDTTPPPRRKVYPAAPFPCSSSHSSVARARPTRRDGAGVRLQTRPTPVSPGAEMGPSRHKNGCQHATSASPSQGPAALRLPWARGDRPLGERSGAARRNRALALGGKGERPTRPARGTARLPRAVPQTPWQPEWEVSGSSWCRPAGPPHAALWPLRRQAGRPGPPPAQPVRQSGGDPHPRHPSDARPRATPPPG